MGRPKKAAAASRANGGRAANKGKVVNGKEELFGGYDTDGTYVVKKILVKRELAKGKITKYDQGCERDVLMHVFTFAFTSGEFKTSNDSSGPSSDAATYFTAKAASVSQAGQLRAKRRLR